MNGSSVSARHHTILSLSVKSYADPRKHVLAHASADGLNQLVILACAVLHVLCPACPRAQGVPLLTLISLLYGLALQLIIPAAESILWALRCNTNMHLEHEG